MTGIEEGNMRCVYTGIHTYPTEVPSGPMLVLNIRLKAKGKVRGLPVVGDLMPYFYVYVCVCVCCQYMCMSRR